MACAYAVAVVGTHRFGVWRRRAKAHGFPTLQWLDWEALLQGVIPNRGEGPSTLPFDGGPAVPGGGLATTLIEGEPLAPEVIAGAGFRGSEARWLETLSLVRHRPDEALERISRSAADTAAGAYLREHLELNLGVGPLSLELAVFRSKRRLAQALARFETAPELYFARARASAELGLVDAVLDDLARAVYFSRERPFFAQAIVGLGFAAEARPALHQQCEQVLARHRSLGSTA